MDPFRINSIRNADSLHLYVGLRSLGFRRSSTLLISRAKEILQYCFLFSISGTVMDRESVLEKFETLSIWRKDGARAPHKPLLVIYAIGELLRGKDRLLPYSELDENFGQLLSEYGPRRTRQGTQYPFWRLQSDGFWEVSDAENVRLTASRDAFKRDLIDHQVRGGFTEEIASQLQTDSSLASEVVQKLLEGHFPDTWHEDILQGAGIELTSKGIIRQKRDPQFRANILRAYEYRCAVCGFDVRLGQQPVALEAAHIKWHQAGGPDVEANGLALCTLHHKLFDLGAFALSSDLVILVSDDAHGTSGFQEWLMNFHGNRLSFPQRQTYYPSENYTRWHVREVFKGEYRER